MQMIKDNNEIAVIVLGVIWLIVLCIFLTITLCIHSCPRVFNRILHVVFLLLDKTKDDITGLPCCFIRIVFLMGSSKRGRLSIDFTKHNILKKTRTVSIYCSSLRIGILCTYHGTNKGDHIRKQMASGHEIRSLQVVETRCPKKWIYQSTFHFPANIYSRMTKTDTYLILQR